MKARAFILFFPLMVFLIETSSFFPAMKNACAILAVKKNNCSKEKNTCSKIKQGDKCCSKKSAEAPVDNTCNDKADCSTCPVCYSFILQQQFELPAQQFFIKKNYVIVNTGDTSSFTSNVWKPPNGPLNIS